MGLFFNEREDRFNVGRIIFAVIALFLVLGVVGAGCRVVGGYTREAERVISVDNVKEQWDAIITDWQSMQTAADNACNAQQMAKNEDSPTLVEDPALAYKATYRQIVVDYNQRQANLFKASKVGPPGYPKRVPVVGPNDDFCEVSDYLRTVKE